MHKSGKAFSIAAISESLGHHTLRGRHNQRSISHVAALLEHGSKAIILPRGVFCPLQQSIVVQLKLSL